MTNSFPSAQNSSGKKSRRRKSSSVLPSLLRPFRSLVRRLKTISESRLLTALPLFSYMLLGSIYALAVMEMLTDLNSYPMFWSAGVYEAESDKLVAELIKQKFQVAGYLITLFVLAFRLPQMWTFFTRERTLLLLVIALLLTTISSSYPDRVAINLFHLVMGILATWLYFDDTHRQQNIVYNACFITLFSIIIPLSGSALLFYLHESSSIDAIVAGSRFSGLVGNPNTLGGVCIAAAWAIFGLISLTPFRSKSMMLLVLAFSIVMFNAWSTGSATTLSVISFLAALMIGHKASKLLGRKANAALILGGTTLFFVALFVLVVQQNADDFALAATDAVGKDLTLTGRTDFWMIAWEAIVERPVLGWGYDNHQTVMDNPLYNIPFNHFHNGYLDSLIVGGMVFGAAIVISYTSFIARYRTCKNKIGYSFPLLVAIAAVSVQNFTEYSLFRNNTAVWHIYFVSFMAVAITTVKTQPSNNSSGARRRKKRSSSGMSW